MSDEKKNDKVETVCDTLFHKYPVQITEKLNEIIATSAAYTEASVILSNDGKPEAAAKAAAMSVARAPLTAVAGVLLAAHQIVVGTTVLAISAGQMAIGAIQKRTEAEAEPEAPAAPAAE